VTLLGSRQPAAPAGHEPTSEEDAEFWTTLVRRVEQGDRDAEANLISRFEQRIRVMASSRLHGADAALDLAQDVLLAALKALRVGSLREPDKLPAFIAGIARNIINNHFRKTARSVEVGGELPDCDVARPEPGVAQADGERRQLVRECLERLNLLDRRILLLTLVEGLNPREIAPILRLTPEVVRTRKSRAVQAVREQIRKRDTKGAAKLQK
jgi:RNA polymerase sigma-70 factor (ECF subfamily)